MNDKRYWTSRGIVVPERIVIDQVVSDDPYPALVLAFESAKRAGATLDRCLTFWRQELGAFWLSTRELG